MTEFTEATTAETFGPWKYVTFKDGGAKLTRLSPTTKQVAEVLWRQEPASSRNTADNVAFDSKLAELRAVYAALAVEKVACSVDVKCYLRRPGISDKVGPFETETDAKMAAILLNAYHHEAESTWEAYSVKTVVEEKIL